MMRKGPLALCAALAAAVILPKLGEAQVQPWTLSLGGGPSFPMAEFADDAKNGFHSQVSLGYEPSRLPIGFRADIFYQTFSNRERVATTIQEARDIGVDEEWFRQFSVLVNATYAPALGSIQPYALVGPGLVREWYNDRSYWGRRNLTVRLNAGAGVNFALVAGMIGYVEVRYLNAFGGSAMDLRPPAVNRDTRMETVPVTAGFRVRF